MNLPDSLAYTRLAHAVTVLSQPGLIRLVSEIDDNGPIPRRALTRTLSGLSRNQIRHAVDTARDHHMVRVGQRASDSCYLLTRTGRGLADVYDLAARWARNHNHPTEAASDFVTRIQQTLALFADRQVFDALSAPAPAEPHDTAQQLADVGLLPTTEAVRDLRRPWTALTQWLTAHPHLRSAAARGSLSAVPAGVERAA
ncbi:hypothetical protein ACIRQP_35145 [Streptomyces sp. NPDC102274]|uniref:hypothetical protein n=1 Tax=Streptomyces sp. NPDC102274 TaxID=3366151 RepID=UPI0038018D5F